MSAHGFMKDYAPPPLHFVVTNLSLCAIKGIHRICAGVNLLSTRGKTSPEKQEEKN